MFVCSLHKTRLCQGENLSIFIPQVYNEKENSIYIRSLCVQTKIKRIINSNVPLYGQNDMSLGFVPLLDCRLFSVT